MVSTVEFNNNSQIYNSSASCMPIGRITMRYNMSLSSLGYKQIKIALL